MNARSDNQPKISRRPVNPDLPYGVYFRKHGKKPYMARVRRQKVVYFLGNYAHPEAAHFRVQAFLRTLT